MKLEQTKRCDNTKKLIIEFEKSQLLQLCDSFLFNYFIIAEIDLIEKKNDFFNKINNDHAYLVAEKKTLVENYQYITTKINDRVLVIFLYFVNYI
jgi:hypothetical protein